MGETSDIVEHYKRKGLYGYELARSLYRHARLIRPLEPRISLQLVAIANGIT